MSAVRHRLSNSPLELVFYSISSVIHVFVELSDSSLGVALMVHRLALQLSV